MKKNLQDSCWGFLASVYWHCEMLRNRPRIYSSLSVMTLILMFRFGSLRPLKEFIVIVKIDSSQDLMKLYNSGIL